MPIRIKRKPNTRLTWEANALFRESFPAEENTFTIPNINWMIYLYKSFDLIEATDENGDDIDLSKVVSCCKGSIKLEVIKAVKTVKTVKESSPVMENTVVVNINDARNEDSEDASLFTE